MNERNWKRTDGYVATDPNAVPPSARRDRDRTEDLARRDMKSADELYQDIQRRLRAGSGTAEIRETIIDGYFQAAQFFLGVPLQPAQTTGLEQFVRTWWEAAMKLAHDGLEVCFRFEDFHWYGLKTPTHDAWVEVEICPHCRGSVRTLWEEIQRYSLSLIGNLSVRIRPGLVRPDSRSRRISARAYQLWQSRVQDPGRSGSGDSHKGGDWFEAERQVMAEEFGGRTLSWRTVDENAIEVNLDVHPKLPFETAAVAWPKTLERAGWVRIERRKDRYDDRLLVGAHAIAPHPSYQQYGRGERDLLAEDTLHPNVLDALLDNVHLIPDSWKVDGQAHRRDTLFSQVAFCDSKGEEDRVCVRYLYWTCHYSQGWRQGYLWLDKSVRARLLR